MHTGEVIGSPHAEPLAQATFTEAEIALRDDSAAQTQRDSFLRPKDAREDLLAHSGLLTGRGHQQLGFYHLSIQEFLAAERIFELRLHDLKPVFLERASSAGWRNTLSFLFGRYMAVFSVLTRPLALLHDLVSELLPERFGLQLVLADCAEMLAAKGYPLDGESAGRLRRLLLESMATRESAKERCEAGLSLGNVGDPRFDPERWFLPAGDEAPLGFLKVEAGPFVMGSDPKRDENAEQEEQPQHEIELAEFYIARYPVTVAQFAAFVRDSGYQTGDEDSLRAAQNHPVVLVSWHDAMAYCDWLTEQLRTWKSAPGPIDVRVAATVRNGWRVTLPTEAEWEKAARGTDGRIYPWGDAFDSGRGNVSETGIARTSAVGAFAGGRSPSGALDMSGNVWEWTRSLWGPDWQTPEFGYPYRPDDSTREDLSASDSVRRVVRGGSFLSFDLFARPACRGRDLPGARFDFLGFRVVVSRSGS